MPITAHKITRQQKADGYSYQGHSSLCGMEWDYDNHFYPDSGDIPDHKVKCERCWYPVASPAFTGKTITI